MVKRNIYYWFCFEIFICPWTSQIKDLNGEKIIGSFYEKELLWSILSMSYYPESDGHIRDKVKVVLDLPNYAIEKELDTFE